MKKNEKKMILILIIISALIIGIIYFITRQEKEINVQNDMKNSVSNEIKEEFIENKQNGTKVNISSKLKEQKNLEELKVDNIKLTEKNGQLKLVADVTNETEQDIKHAFNVNIILINKEGKEIATILGVISPMKIGETKKLSVGITEDYSNIYDIKIVKK